MRGSAATSRRLPAASSREISSRTSPRCSSSESGRVSAAELLRRAPAPELPAAVADTSPVADAVPQLLAIVEWDEGPRFSTELVNVDPSDLAVGMRVRPVFFDYPEYDVTMLRYEPA